ncbi:MAG: flagellar hook-basal body protein [Lachnospiraceae bacterium]|nr:flagellar hook-basal body protein [Lachnospiraceae bacterium]
MVRGLYTAYTGMVNQQKRLDTITNNLANASTTGYKREGATARAFNEYMGVRVNDATVGYKVTNIGNMSLGVKIGENYTDYSQGSLRNTENTYDLALEGNGFFSISFTNKQGEQSIKYTRDGNFTLDAEGALRTTDGDFVQGENGDIYIPTDAAQVAITSTGDIYADGEYIDTVKIVDFEDYNYLKKYGENMYDIVDGAVETKPTAILHQGYLEASNINAVSEMVEMITITRAYESNQKALQTADSMIEKAVNEVGRLG